MILEYYAKSQRCTEPHILAEPFFLWDATSIIDSSKDRRCVVGAFVLKTAIFTSVQPKV